MAHQVRPLAALADDWPLISRTHTGLFTATCYSISKDLTFYTLFGLQRWPQAHTQTNIDTYIFKNEINTFKTLDHVSGGLIL